MLDQGSFARTGKREMRQAGLWEKELKTAERKNKEERKKKEAGKEANRSRNNASVPNKNAASSTTKAGSSLAY